jgi:hypothetical protein
MIAPNTMLRLECIVVNVLDVERQKKMRGKFGRSTSDLSESEVRGPRSDAALYYHAKR